MVIFPFPDVITGATMKFGLQINAFNWQGYPASIRARLAELARTAEGCGFSSLWVMDHFFQIADFGPPEDPMLEAYTTLGYLAGLTEQATLGVMVSGVMYRYPGVLVKTATTLDVLAGGRSYFGIGAAWFEGEAKALGIPFPSIGERFERLEEAIQIALQMWSEHAEEFNGQYYQLDKTLCVPRPVSHPRPKLLIGGMGEKKTLRLVAKYADACNIWHGLGVDGVKRKLDIVQRHCDAERRNYDEIEKTTIGEIKFPADTSAKEAITFCKDLARLGIEHVIVELPRPIEPAVVKRFADEVMAEARAF
jgi:F420-dependent oxidoreductase-like protein